MRGAVEEFSANCGELAGSKEIAHRVQGKCNSDPVLHRAEPVAGCCAPPQSSRRSMSAAPPSTGKPDAIELDS